ncbi:MAG: glutamate--tRNA ligase [Chloroflexota bacterium]
MDNVRVRFAPSPTGTPHIGNVRTALFNWLFARHHGGKFVLRIEDTDVARRVPGAIEAIMDGLCWLGLDWDEGPEVGGPLGPYFQSERLHLYRQYAAQLVEQGDAYYCYCSPARLTEMRAEQERRKESVGYDRRCRYLTPAERGEAEASGVTPVVRFAMPLEGETTYYDLLRGDVTIQNSVLDDFVILKSDGYPTYHFAVVVDDHHMHISHVLRADEWIPSTPRHVLLYRALGWDLPQFAHLPIILGPDRSKLSKRHGATSITAYREEGYLPEALVNFLALLGWSYDGVTEVFSREDLIARFDLDRVGKTAAVFDREKLEWMNGYYIRQLSDDDLARRMYPFFVEEGLVPEEGAEGDEMELVRRVAPLVRERIKRLVEAPSIVDFVFKGELVYDPALLAPKGITPEKARENLVAARQTLGQLAQWDHEELEAQLRPLASELGVKTGQLFGSLRVAITGRTVAPPLFETMAVLGRERTLERVDKAIEMLGK